MKYYYGNLLANQNITAKTDIVWASDFTTLQVPGEDEKTLNILLCIDLHTNYILSYTTSLKKIKSSDTVRIFKKLIKDMFPFFPEGKPNIPIILHTDRGTQFTSKTYKNFVEQFQGFIEPSMSRRSTPKDNAVMERFVRTFKEHRIDGIKIQDKLDAEIFYDPKFLSFRKLISQYVKSLNQRVNKKTSPYTPVTAYKQNKMASKLMSPPVHTKAFSYVYGDDPRLVHVKQYQQEAKETHQALAEVAAVRAELVNRTPFDTEDQNLFMNAVLFEVEKLSIAVENNPQIIKQHVENAVEPLKEDIGEVKDGISVVDSKIDKLLPKPKKGRNVQKLRDPIDQELFPIFLRSAGSGYKRKKKLMTAQLRICYTILYHIGLRVNELRVITLKEIQEAMETSQIPIITFKTKQSHTYVLSKKAIQDLKERQADFDIVFQEHKYKYLFGKDKPVHEKSLIRLINKDLKYTCNLNNIYFNVKSHSFRIHVISSLLKITSVQNAADIIGHNDIRSTLKYSRYSMSKKQIQELMDTIANSRPERLNEIEEDNLT